MLSAIIPLPFISISRLLSAAEDTVLFGPISLGRTTPRIDDVLVLIVHEDLALRLDHQVAARQYGDHLAVMLVWNVVLESVAPDPFTCVVEFASKSGFTPLVLTSPGGR